MTQRDNAAGAGSRSFAGAERLLGTVIDGRFELLEVLGRGGMGVVFSARQVSVDRRVALKVLHDDGDVAAERFAREARVMAQIAHPNIVSVIDVGRLPEERLLYYAMELVEGESLHEISVAGRLHPNLAIEFTMQICSGLAEAHARGVIHRDLKPANMIVTVASDGAVQLKVLDFGIALASNDNRLTGTGSLFGTPSFMSPEHAQGHEITAAADLYALGINLFKMLAGQVPFSGFTPLDVALKQVREEAPSLRPFVEAGLVPAPLVALCEELLAKSPSARPPSAAAVRQRLLAIRAALGEGPVVVSPPSLQSLRALVRPPLDRERVEEVPAHWLPGGSQEPPTAPLPAPRTAPMAEAPAGPERAGGGWDAFHATPSLASSDAQPLVLSPVTGEFMSVPESSPPTTGASPEPRPLAPSAAAPRRGGARSFSAEELVPDLPPKVVPPPAAPAPSRSSFGALGFVVVAALAFLAAAVALGIFDDRPPRAPVPEPAVQPEPPAPAPAAAPKRAKKKASPKPEVIDVFEDAPEDAPDKPPIIIEEAK